MKRRKSLAILLLITCLLMHFKFFLTYQWQGSDQSLKASNVCPLEAKRSKRSLMTYGSLKDAKNRWPLTMAIDGARVLLLAYAR